MSDKINIKLNMTYVGNLDDSEALLSAIKEHTKPLMFKATVRRIETTPTESAAARKPRGAT